MKATLTLRSDSRCTHLQPHSWKGRWVSRAAANRSATIIVEPAGVGYWWQATCDQGDHSVGSCNPHDKPTSVEQAMLQAEARCEEYFLED